MTTTICQLFQDIGGRLNWTSNTNGTHLISMLTFVCYRRQITDFEFFVFDAIGRSTCSLLKVLMDMKRKLLAQQEWNWKGSANLTIRWKEPTSL